VGRGRAGAANDFNVDDRSDDGSDDEDDGAVGDDADAQDHAEDDDADAAAAVAVEEPEFPAEQVAKADELVGFFGSSATKTAIKQAYRKPSLLVQEALVDKVYGSCFELIATCSAHHNESVPAILHKLAGLEGRLRSLSTLATATAVRAVPSGFGGGFFVTD
jgi:hypothetical protein